MIFIALHIFIPIMAFFVVCITIYFCKKEGKLNNKQEKNEFFKSIIYYLKNKNRN